MLYYIYNPTNGKLIVTFVLPRNSKLESFAGIVPASTIVITLTNAIQQLNKVPNSLAKHYCINQIEEKIKVLKNDSYLKTKKNYNSNKSVVVVFWNPKKEG